MSGLLPYEPKKNFRKKVQEEKRSTFLAVQTFFRSNSFPYSNIDTGGIKNLPYAPTPWILIGPIMPGQKGMNPSNKVYFILCPEYQFCFICGFTFFMLNLFGKFMFNE